MKRGQRMELSEFKRIFAEFNSAYPPRFRPALVNQHYRIVADLTIDRFSQVLDWCSENLNYPPTPKELREGVLRTQFRLLPEPELPEPEPGDNLNIKGEIAKMMAQFDKAEKADLLARSRKWRLAP